METYINIGIFFIYFTAIFSLVVVVYIIINYNKIISQARKNQEEILRKQFENFRKVEEIKQQNDQKMKDIQNKPI